MRSKGGVFVLIEDRQGRTERIRGDGRLGWRFKCATEGATKAEALFAGMVDRDALLPSQRRFDDHTRENPPCAAG
jgi:hypothetical protein